MSAVEYGPGKYDDLCTYVREQSNAVVAIVIVLGGTKGTGFSVQSLAGDVSDALPQLLRDMADDMDAAR